MLLAQIIRLSEIRVKQILRQLTTQEVFTKGVRGTYLYNRELLR